MPKQYYIIRDFSGGINTRQDPRDLRENESSFIQNMSVDALGKIKTVGKMYAHIEDQDGDTNLSEYIVQIDKDFATSGGYGLFYFESDHSRDSEQTITETKSGEPLAIGTGDGNIKFIAVKTAPDEGPADDSPL
jgi:hypothetical protein